MWKVLFWIAGLGLLFGGGYITGVWTSDDPVYEMSIQKEGADQPSGRVLSDVDNRAEIDSMLGILLDKEPAERVSVDVEQPDASVDLVSKERHIGLADYRLWFIDGGAILAEKKNGTWQDASFYKIDERDTAYIQSMLRKED